MNSVYTRFDYVNVCNPCCYDCQTWCCGSAGETIQFKRPILCCPSAKWCGCTVATIQVTNGTAQKVSRRGPPSSDTLSRALHTHPFTRIASAGRPGASVGGYEIFSWCTRKLPKAVTFSNVSLPLFPRFSVHHMRHSSQQGRATDGHDCT